MSAAVPPDYRWRLRGLMAERGMWKTTELIPLLADRGITLSAAQVYRLVAGVPQRLSLHTLAALCDILGCTPNDLVDVQRTNLSEQGQPPPERGKAESGTSDRMRPARDAVVLQDAVLKGGDDG